MQTITCTTCRSEFDATQMEPGLRFICANCGTQLQVPIQAQPRPATPVAPRAAPPARPAAPSRRGAPPPSRRNAPPPSRRPAPPPSGRRSGGSRRGGSYERPERSNLPLVLGGVGAVVVIVVIIAVLALSGGGNENPMGNTVQNPKPSEPTAAQRINKLQAKIISASKDPIRLEALGQEAKRLGAPSLFVLAAEFALKVDETLDWANEAKGRKRYDASGLPDEDEVLYPTKDWALLMDLRERGWLEPDAVKEMEEAKVRFGAHVTKLKADGHYRRVWQTRTSVKLHPLFKDYPYDTEDKRPYLIFLQSTTDPKKAEKVRKLAEKKGRIFQCLYKVFMEKFGKDLGIEKLESADYQEDVILRAWVFADRKSFTEFNEKVGIPGSGGMGAYYNPRDQWMIIPTGAAGQPGMNIRGQDMDTNVSFHEGLHQLVHHVTKKVIEKETGKEVNWIDPRLDSDSMWFQEGVAEWFGSALPEGDSWKPFQINYYRLQGWKMYRDRKADEWTFPELLAAEDNGDLNVMGKPYMGALFYGQAWAFVHFLWNFEDGKYRAKFLEYLKGELHGESGLRQFRKVFGIEKPEGSQMEKEFEAYCDELLKKV